MLSFPESYCRPSCLLTPSSAGVTVTLGLPGLLLSWGVWSFEGCLSPSKGPGLRGSGVAEEPTVNRGWELTVTIPGETVVLVGGGEAAGRRKRERERERENVINIYHSLITSCKMCY